MPGHDCYEKAREIRRRTGIILGLDAHDVVSELCREWGCANADEFYKKMGEMSDDVLAANVKAAWDRVKKKKVVRKAISPEVSAYA